MKLTIRMGNLDGFFIVYNENIIRNTRSTVKEMCQRFPIYDFIDFKTN